MLPHLDPMHILALHCPQCPFLTLSVTRLFEHCLGHEEPVDCALYQCAHCGIVGTHLGILEEHTKAWHPASEHLPLKQISRCTLQQRSTADGSMSSSDPAKSSISLPQKTCLFCGIQNTDNMELQAHYRNVHNVHNVKLTRDVLHVRCSNDSADSDDSQKADDDSGSPCPKKSRNEETIMSTMAKAANFHFKSLESAAASFPVISSLVDGTTPAEPVQLEESDTVDSDEDRRLMTSSAAAGSSIVDLEDEESSDVIELDESGQAKEQLEFSLGMNTSNSGILFANNEPAGCSTVSSLPVFPSPEPVGPAGTFVTRYVFHGQSGNSPSPPNNTAQLPRAILSTAPCDNGTDNAKSLVYESAAPMKTKNPPGRPSTSGGRPPKWQRFTDRCVQSLTKNIARWGGTVRLLRDATGAERFVVRCNFCLRDVRLAGKRTWNFTGVHVPSCLSRIRRFKDANSVDEKGDLHAPELADTAESLPTFDTMDDKDGILIPESEGLRLPVLEQDDEGMDAEDCSRLSSDVAPHAEQCNA